jgi:hypothetical protein
MLSFHTDRQINFFGYFRQSHERRSASSTQFSIKLAVAMSL